MKASEVEKLMKDIGIAYAYYTWPENGAPDLPYLCYYFPTGTTESADNTVWNGVLALNIELYTARRSTENEAKVEKALADYDLPFERSEIYLSDEHMYEVLYETEVIIDG